MINIMPYVFEQLGDFTQRKEWYNFACPYHHGEEHHMGVNFIIGKYKCFVCGVSGSVRDLFFDLKNGTIRGVNKYGLLNRLNTVERNRRYLPDSLKEISMSGRGYMSDCHGYTFSAARDILRSDDGQDGRPRMFSRPHRRYLPDSLTGVSILGLGSVSNGHENTSSTSEDTFRVLDKKFRDRYTSLRSAEDSMIIRKAKEYIKSRGIDIWEMEVGILDGYENRVTFPFIVGGLVVYWQARAIYDMPLKTINPSESDGWLTKSNVLYGLDEMKGHRKVVIGEGLFDCYSAGKFMGIPYTCLLGTSISKCQVRLLKKAGIRDVLVFLDNDANSQAVKISVMLWHSHFNVDVVIWKPEHNKKDPNSIDKMEMKYLIDNSYHLNHATSIELPLLFC